jgi:hypothetical protein
VKGKYVRIDPSNGKKALINDVPNGSWIKVKITKMTYVFQPMLAMAGGAIMTVKKVAPHCDKTAIALLKWRKRRGLISAL